MSKWRCIVEGFYIVPVDDFKSFSEQLLEIEQQLTEVLQYKSLAATEEVKKFVSQLESHKKNKRRKGGQSPRSNLFGDNRPKLNKYLNSANNRIHVPYNYSSL